MYERGHNKNFLKVGAHRELFAGRVIISFLLDAAEVPGQQVAHQES
jgi:hypothetical protein